MIIFIERRRFQNMNNKISKILLFFYFASLVTIIYAQNTKKYVTQSSVLFLAFDDIILNKNISMDSIFKSKPQKLCIYNSNKSEWIKIIGYEFIPQPKLQSPGIIVVNSDIINEEVKAILKKLKPGDILYFNAYAKINQILYSITFGYKIGGEIKNIHIIVKSGSVADLEIVK